MHVKCRGWVMEETTRGRGVSIQIVRWGYTMQNRQRFVYFQEVERWDTTCVPHAEFSRRTPPHSSHQHRWIPRCSPRFMRSSCGAKIKNHVEKFLFWCLRTFFGDRYKHRAFPPKMRPPRAKKIAGWKLEFAYYRGLQRDESQQIANRCPHKTSAYTS